MSYMLKILNSYTPTQQSHAPRPCLSLSLSLYLERVSECSEGSILNLVKYLILFADRTGKKQQLLQDHFLLLFIFPPIYLILTL